MNNVCNLHCKMCDVGTGTESSIFFKNLIADRFGNMSLELFDLILEEGRTFPLQPRLSFAYTEPGIHPQIGEMVTRAKRAGYYASLTTNGYTLPRLADVFLEAGLDQLFVSIDGPKTIHDRIRGNSHSYDRIVEGLSAVRRRGRSPAISAGFVFTEESYLSLSDLLAELVPFRPISVVASLLNFIHPESAARHNVRFGGSFPATVTNLERVDLSAFDFRAFSQAIGDARRRARALDIDLSILPDLSSPEDLRRYHAAPEDPVGGHFCTDPWTMLMIQTNGDAIPAHGRCFNTVLGNIRSTSLRAIWNGAKLLQLRRLLKAEGGLLPACTRCCGCRKS